MSWLVACLSLLATVLNVRRIRACFFLWFVTNSFWAAHDFTHGLPSRGCLMTIYVALAVQGWLAWRPRP